MFIAYTGLGVIMLLYQIPNTNGRYTIVEPEYRNEKMLCKQ